MASMAELARMICSSPESLLQSPHGYQLKLFPLQRAICRVVAGQPLGELATHPDVLAGFGGASAVAALPSVRPTEVIVIAAVRTFKSQLSAANAICASQNIDIAHLKPGEVPRVCVVSLTLDLAHATFGHIAGVLQASPVLSSLMAGRPTTDSVFLRHPSGRLVEIKVVPLAGAGSSLVSRWLCGAIFDEAPRCPVDGVKSLSDARTNVMGRLLPGAQMLTVGSPWSPTGPIPDLDREHFGNPSRRVVVVKGTGPMLNPSWWTPERCASIAQTDPDAYRTDVMGQYLDPETALISSLEVDATTRIAPAELPFEADHSYVAAIDPATRDNAFTLVLLTRDRDRVRVALSRQWCGSKAKPLSPDAVLCEIASVLKPYGVTDVISDQFSFDALRDLGERHHLRIFVRNWTAALKLERFEALRLAISQREIELPPDRQLRADLLNVRRRVTQSGITVDLPKTVDGRHCDYAAALALGFGEHLAAPLVRDPDAEDDACWPRIEDPYDALEREFGYA